MKFTSHGDLLWYCYALENHSQFSSSSSFSPRRIDKWTENPCDDVNGIFAPMKPKFPPLSLRSDCFVILSPIHHVYPVVLFSMVWYDAKHPLTVSHSRLRWVLLISILAKSTMVIAHSPWTRTVMVNKQNWSFILNRNHFEDTCTAHYDNGCHLRAKQQCVLTLNNCILSFFYKRVCKCYVASINNNKKQPYSSPCKMMRRDIADENASIELLDNLRQVVLEVGWNAILVCQDEGQWISNRY